MDMYVACDICGHRYVLPPEREGRKSKCKSCGMPFEIIEENFYDPQTSEMDDEPEDEDGDGSTGSPMWEILQKIGHGLAAMATLSLLIWMASLVVRSPQQVAAQSSTQAATARVIHPQRQSEAVRPFPQFTPGGPPSFDPRQRLKPGAGMNPVPQFKPAPPAVDGSIGWPTSDPEPSGTRK